MNSSSSFQAAQSAAIHWCCLPMSVKLKVHWKAKIYGLYCSLLTVHVCCLIPAPVLSSVNITFCAMVSVLYISDKYQCPSQVCAACVVWSKRQSVAAVDIMIYEQTFREDIRVHNMNVSDHLCPQIHNVMNGFCFKKIIWNEHSLVRVSRLNIKQHTLSMQNLCVCFQNARNFSVVLSQRFFHDTTLWNPDELSQL